MNVIKRNLANAASFTNTITMDGDTMTIVTATHFQSHTIKFKFGEPFEEKTADGRHCETTVTMEGDKMVQTQIDKKQGGTNSKIERYFEGDVLLMILTADGTDIVSRREYKKVN